MADADNSINPFDGYTKKVEGEPHFTLLARDPQAGDLIRWWADNKEVTEPDRVEQIATARKLADDMDAWRHEHRPDNPDITYAEEKTGKQTSAEISSLAATYMSLSSDNIAKNIGLDLEVITSDQAAAFEAFCRNVRRISASAVSQDETKG